MKADLSTKMLPASLNIEMISCPSILALTERQSLLERQVPRLQFMFGTLITRKRLANSIFKVAPVELLLAVFHHAVAMLPLLISLMTIE